MKLRNEGNGADHRHAYGMTGSTGCEVRHDVFGQPGRCTIELDAGLHPPGVHGIVGAQPLPIIDAEAGADFRERCSGPGRFPTEPGTFAPRRLLVAHQDQRQRHAPLANQRDLIVKGTNLSGEHRGIGMLTRVDDEHHAELAAPLRTQGHDAFDQTRQLIHTRYPQIAAVVGHPQRRLISRNFTKQPCQAVAAHQYHRLPVGYWRPGHLVGQIQLLTLIRSPARCPDTGHRDAVRHDQRHDSAQPSCQRDNGQQYQRQSGGP